jgi:hypothetical protein
MARLWAVVPLMMMMMEKRWERKTDHSPPSTTEDRNTWSLPSTPPPLYVFITWCLSTSTTFSFVWILTVKQNTLKYVRSSRSITHFEEIKKRWADRVDRMCEVINLEGEE